MATVGKYRLYRFFDADRNLLYIGETGRIPLVRLLEHIAEQGWAHEVAFFEVDPRSWKTEAAVLAAEAAAIAAERPRFNWQGNEGNANRVWVPKVAEYRYRSPAARRPAGPVATRPRPSRAPTRPAPAYPPRVRSMRSLLAAGVLLALALWAGLSFAAVAVLHLAVAPEFGAPFGAVGATLLCRWWLGRR